ncbi:Uncharacterised protein [Salmonella enterica subsp. enterica]|uniref:Uncharacterized protein n=1 Tax=Salmonella enterica I TaxID=59201 RepID=A0A3S4FA34_SALET|nr:Uncharacterised protein [Salmonella enterica subsp. enterica]
MENPLYCCLLSGWQSQFWIYLSYLYLLHKMYDINLRIFISTTAYIQIFLN